MAIALPDVRVTELQTGFVSVAAGRSYRVGNSGIAAAYIAERGAFQVQLRDGRTFQVEPGGHCSIPKGTEHLIVGGDGAPSWATASEPSLHSQPGEDAEVVIFAAMLSTTVNPLPDIVPDIFILTADEMRREHRLDLAFRLLRETSLESPEIRAPIACRLAEIISIILLEYVLRQLEGEGLNAISGVTDLQIRRVLQAIHGAPEQDWSLERLARHAGLSRSVLAERFKTLLGHTPMDYLARIRIAVATKLLQANQHSIQEIAYQSGYNSDAAFHKAFKRMTGLSPRAYRQMYLNGEQL